jgi:hypothetical protein
VKLTSVEGSTILPVRPLTVYLFKLTTEAAPEAPVAIVILPLIVQLPLTYIIQALLLPVRERV